MDIAELDQIENQLLAAVYEHPALQEVATCSREQLVRMLLEDTCASHRFAEFCERAVMGWHTVKKETQNITLKEAAAEAAQCMRNLMHEEFVPQFHREDMIEDLERFGVPPRVVLNHRHSAATLDSNQKILDLLSPRDSSPEEYAVRLLVNARLHGEAVTSVEMSRLVEGMKRFGFDESQSTFFVPHRDHDRKNKPLTAMSGPMNLHSHTDYLNTVYLKILQLGESQVSSAADITKHIGQLRTEYYDQFLVK